MSRPVAANLTRDLAALFGGGTLADLTDGQLLDRFIAHRDDLSFEGLVARHGPMVLAICRRSLDDPRDIDDAFQAIFLILVRKASSLRDRSAVSSWLYGVALRVARRARENARRRHFRERPLTVEPATRALADREIIGDEALAIVDEEIRRLPRDQQVAVIHCLLRGGTHEAAAAELGWPLGTVKSRIATARQTLKRRLTRRGLSPCGIAAILRTGVGLGEPSGPISPHLVELTRRAAIHSLGGASPLTASMPARIADLIQEASKLMLITRVQAAAMLVMTLTALAWTAPGLLRARSVGLVGTSSAHHGQPTRPPAAGSQPPRMDRYGDPLPAGVAMRLGSVRFRHERAINHIAYSPDGRFLVFDDRRRSFQVRDPNTSERVRQFDSGLKDVRCFAFSPDGETIAAVGNHYDENRDVMNHRLTFTDFATGRQLRQAEWDDGNNVRRVFYAPDGKTVLTVTDTAGFQLWDIATMRIIHREASGKAWGPEVAISPAANSHLLAIAGSDSIRFFDTEHLRDVRTIADEKYHANHVLFSPDGTTVIVERRLKGTNHDEFGLWRVGDGVQLRRFSSAKTTRLSDLTFSPDGKILAGIGGLDQLVCFDAATGKELDILSEARATEGPLAFSPDGATLATLAGSQTLHLWDRTTGQDRLASPDSHQDCVGSIAFVDEGRTLVSFSRDKTIRFWDLTTGRPSKVVAVPYPESGRSLSVRADGVLLAAGQDHAGFNARVWDLETGEPLHSWSLEAGEDKP
jgi:RNA polymerase sigma factor (sigma-70 family)